MTFPGLTYQVLAADRTIDIDGVPLDEIASLSGKAEMLEYEDICLYFDKTPDEFSPNMFRNMLAEIYRADSNHLSLWDDVTGGLSASKNHASANTSNHYLMFEYLWESRNPFQQEAIFGEDPVKRIVAVLKMDRALINDVDRKRAGEIIDHFTSKGCERFDDLGDLIDIFIENPARDDIFGPKMDRLNSSLVCQYKTIVGDFKQYSASFDGLANVRQRSKSVTYTDFGRMVLLQAFLQKAAEDIAGDARHFNNVLIVGPGLEQLHPVLREKSPRQSFEPFAVIDWLAKNGLANVADINVDLVDISDRVVEYFDGIAQRAFEAGSLKLYCAGKIGDFGSGIEEVRVSGELDGVVTVSIPPDVVKRLNITGGDIITDHIAGDGRYDMVVILNTFMYFTPDEKLTALENIARLLSPGGILITDVEQEFISKSSALSPLSSIETLPLKIQAYRKK